MTTLDIVQQRLHNKHLLGAPFARPDEVVQWFGAIQAQEYLGATWGIAQRMDGLTQAAIDQAYADDAILRTHNQLYSNLAMPAEVGLPMEHRICMQLDL